MPTQASIEIQDLTYTEKQLGLGVTVTYKNGGTAGSELVEVDDVGKHLITVTIESGTSTATQIKAAVDAHKRAAELVTVSITGTGSNAQVTCVEATLASGSEAIKASKQLNGLYVEALAAGTAGNSIRVKFVNGTADVTVATNDITVTFPNGTDALTVAALINADVEANLLVKATGSSANTLRADMAADFVALAGGAAAVAASVTEQDLKFAWNTADTGGNGQTVTFTTGATAASEVVSVDASRNLTVQIENGVSTATQIKTAIDAEADAVPAAATADITVVDYTQLTGAVLTVNGTDLTEGVDWTAATDNNTTAASLELAVEAVTGINSSATDNVITAVAATAGAAGNAITLASSDETNLTISGSTFAGGHDGFVITIPGTGSNAQVTVNAAATAGAVGDGAYGAYYKDQSITPITDAFVAFTWNFPAKKITLTNTETTGTDTLVVSFDGTNNHAVLTFGQSLVLENTNYYGFRLKYLNAAPNYTLTVNG